MNPYVLAILISSLGMGTVLTFSSYHWLLAWMGLEINTLAIIPLMAQHHHPRAAEAATKYFLIQATAAAMILFASAMNAWATGEWNIFNISNPLASVTLTVALALKVGMAPLHFWMPDVLQGLNLLTGMLLATWQKLAPFALLIQTAQSTNPTLLVCLGILSSLIGGWAGLNQTQLRKILAYSSIAHMGWMIIVLQYSPQLTIIALALYVFMTATAFLALMNVEATKMNSLAMAWSKNPTLVWTSILALLSLGGLPPLSGFLTKWLILQELTKQDLYISATIMAFTALLSLFFYLRLSFAMALTLPPATPNLMPQWRTPPIKATMPLALTMVMALGLLPLAPLIITLPS
uniref:NADH-ubiquinone oxidoreductase chain 2 n=1 Tax=Leptocypris sp. CBM ZF 11419 TaxID=643464 RepID=F3Y710_9TELE|nr:NADH dehydrogenase subunit 2 [Leptocypris sp. CBM ZF 11419]